MNNKPLFPFTAVLGQDNMKRALLICLVNPRAGGALLCGQKGTAKSTLVRSLVQLVKQDLLVELPLNVTEDRLLGGIDLKAALREGKRRYEPGLLHQADGKILYIDEVNLLSDHIINGLLEAAASGQVCIEREGISASYPARFLLLGSMNPEEGKLRPQFLDRFGLFAEVKGSSSVTERAEIIRRRLSYERNPFVFCAQWEEQQQALRRKVQKAIQALPGVSVSDNAMRLAATLSAEANCAGQRAEILMVEAARALAALDERTALNTQDIREAASFVLPHRLRQSPDPPFEPPMPEEEPPTDKPQPENSDEQPQEQQEPQEPQATDDHQAPMPPQSGEETDDEQRLPEEPDPVKPPDDEVQAVGATFEVRPWINGIPVQTIRLGSGRRSLVRTDTKQGRYVRACIPTGDDLGDIALDATIRAAAVHQRGRDKLGMALAITLNDVRTKVRERRTGNTILFAVDASGSMGANQRMVAVKGAVCSLLNDAYQKRDRVGMLAFRNQTAELILPITRSVDLAHKRLANLPTGGRTPLGEGLRLARETLRLARIRDKDILPVLVLVTDGRANATRGQKKPIVEALALAEDIAQSGVKCIVIDTERDYIRLKLAEKLAKHMQADYFRIEDLDAELLRNIVSASVSIGMQG